MRRKFWGEGGGINPEVVTLDKTLQVVTMNNMVRTCKELKDAANDRKARHVLAKGLCSIGG